MTNEPLDPHTAEAVHDLTGELVKSVRDSRNYVLHPFIPGLCRAIALLANPDEADYVTRHLRRACADAVDDICDGTADEMGLWSGEVLRRKIREDIGRHLGFEKITN